MRAMRRSPHHGDAYERHVGRLVLQPGLYERLERIAMRATEPEHLDDLNLSGRDVCGLGGCQHVIVGAGLPLASGEYRVRGKRGEMFEADIASIRRSMVFFRVVARGLLRSG